jgi:hypothetical protein
MYVFNCIDERMLSPSKADVKRMYEKALATCDAVVFVVKSYPEQIADVSLTATINLVRDAAGKACPLAVIGTHSDAQDYSGWTYSNSVELTKVIFPGADPYKLAARTLYCSPAIYQESQSMLELTKALSDEEIAKLDWDELYPSHQLVILPSSWRKAFD